MALEHIAVEMCSTFGMLSTKIKNDLPFSGILILGNFP
jgi:hypothetical protein